MAIEQVGKCAVLLESLLTDLNAFSNPQDFLAFRKDIAFAHGVGANQADKRWSSPGRSLGSTAAETLDLAGGLTDYRGNAITFARIRAIAIFNNGPNNLHVGGGTTAQFINWVANSSDIVVVRPGGLFLLVAPDATGYVVTATTADLLRLANAAAGTITYDIALVGCGT